MVSVWVSTSVSVWVSTSVCVVVCVAWLPSSSSSDPGLAITKAITATATAATINRIRWFLVIARRKYGNGSRDIPVP